MNAWERFIGVPRLPTRAAPDHLHHERHRVAELPGYGRSASNRGRFPNDDAAIKLLWLAIRDIEDKRARARAKEKGLPANQRRAPGRLVDRAVVHG